MPCSQADHLCGQCGHSGHLEFFCPVAPTDRIAYLREQRRLEASGQQLVNHDLRLPFQGVIPQGECHLEVMSARRLANNVQEP